MTGDEIKAERLARDLTQTYIAARVGITRQAIVAWEKGTHPPSPQNLARLEEILASHPASPPMTPAEFVALQARNEWSPRAIAFYFGVSVTHVYQWRFGNLAIPVATRSALREADGRTEVEVLYVIAAAAETARARGLDQIATDLEAIVTRL
jgi:DNA-binding transcriptional regulator YiaG